jgi:hypothetical protein
MTRRRRALVVLRAGDTSLHPAWLNGPSHETRNWDLHLSYFGDHANPFADRPSDVTLSYEKGPKSLGTVACMRKLAERIKSYDWVCFPDDDLAADLVTLNRFFAVVEEYNLDLAQPALGAGSYVWHDITRQRPHMKLRFTTFVEIMAACFSQHALELCAPYLDATLSSYGPDLLFPRLLGYPKDRIAIVDETPVIHTRLVGPNRAVARRLGGDAHQELSLFLDRHRLSPRFETWAGVTADGEHITDAMQIDRCKATQANGAHDSTASVAAGA